ncbi:MAG TPA: MOSC domain-containing protein [Nocardioides sp.]|jgi:MOSC domain-containing protein YiiM|nr:MOSC domain-containing protein [Nocardioides sp.]
MTATIRSVNVGTPRTRAWAEIGRTAIEKHPVTGPVRVATLGLEGDQVGDTEHHGGIDQAVYAFAREDLDAWAEQLGAPIADGMFGENLTTSGIDVNEALVGERWRVGSALLEVASVRIPCNDFKCWMGETGFDNTGWVKRFAAVGRPGPYLRVVEEGALQAGDAVVVEQRPAHGVTVSTMFRALTTDRSLLPELLQVDGLVAEARRAVEKHVASAASVVRPGRA